MQKAKLLVKIEGTKTLEMDKQNGGWIKSTPLVCFRMADEILLLWISQKRMDLLHNGWTFTPIQVHTARQITSLELPSILKRLRLVSKKATLIYPEWPRPEWPQVELSRLGGEDPAWSKIILY